MVEQTGKRKIMADTTSLPPLLVRDSRVLVATDLCWEALFFLIRQRPVMLFFVVAWLLKGRRFLLDQIAKHVRFSPEWMSYNKECLSLLRHQQQAGRPLVLVTDFSQQWADDISKHLGLFDQVFFCSRNRVVAARQLYRFVTEELRSDGRFLFAGTMADQPILHVATGGIAVDGGAQFAQSAELLPDVEQWLRAKKPTWRDYARALRVHQWLKNCLVFVPLITSHRISEISVFFESVAAFVAFSFCASSVYLINDLLDLRADRGHDRKKKRPFAAGRIHLKIGALLVPVLLLLSWLVSLVLPGAFREVLLAYFVLTLAYTFWLKQIVLVDIILLALLYTLRIIAGGAASGIVLSFWLLAFSMFIFFSLALVKRYSELSAVLQKNEVNVCGRGYQVEDMASLYHFGIASGYMSILVLALYIHSADVRLLYSHPQLIWLLCPLLLYWISRMWLLTGRHNMHDDPLLFAMRDRVSQVLVVVGSAILWCAV